MSRTLIKKRGEDTLVFPHVPPVLDPLLNMTDEQKQDLTYKVLDAQKYEKKPWTKFKLTDVQQPRPGHVCYGPMWWCVTADGCVLAFNSALQCNPSEELAESVRAKIHKSCTLQFHEMLFIPLSSWEIRQ